VHDGDELELRVDGKACRLPVKLMRTLPLGVAGLPASQPGLPGIALPAWGKLRSGNADTVGAKR
jgi:hypothetical protein